MNKIQLFRRRYIPDEIKAFRVRPAYGTLPRYQEWRYPCGFSWSRARSRPDSRRSARPPRPARDRSAPCTCRVQNFY